MLINHDRGAVTPDKQIQLSDELMAVLRSRVATQYYNQPRVLDALARAILNSCGIYPSAEVTWDR